jgi:hypothetical protein
MKKTQNIAILLRTILHPPHALLPLQHVKVKVTGEKFQNSNIFIHVILDFLQSQNLLH